MKKITPKLQLAANIVVNKLIKAKPGERMLIMTNPVEGFEETAVAVFRAAQQAKVRPNLLYQNVKSEKDNLEPHVIAAIKSEPDIYFHCSAESSGFDPQRYAGGYNYRGQKYDEYRYLLFAKKKMRGCWTNSCTSDRFAQTVVINYQQMRVLIGKIMRKFNRAHRIYVKTKRGTNFEAGIKTRQSFVDDGDFSKPGLYGNVPAGEAFVSPDLNDVNGTIVIDASMTQRRGLEIKKPIKLELKNNHIYAINGSHEAKMLKSDIAQAIAGVRKNVRAGKFGKKEAEEYIKNCHAIGEIGLGVNPKAKIGHSPIEDEKVINVMHVAIGRNYDFDQVAPIHFDCMLRGPEVVLEYPGGKKETIHKNGKFYL
ncbi:aminopeptidase [Patescibacteria group bacterium]